jgi:hypothetical protein
MDSLQLKITEHSVVVVILILNAIATVYAAFNPKMADKLFDLYTGSTIGLYGYAQQSSTRKISQIGKAATGSAQPDSQKES